MMSSKLLDNKVCLITGAAKGIGKAIAEKFAQQGAIVYVNDRVEGEMDQWAMDTAEEYATSIIPVYFDITDSQASKQAILQIKKDQGHLDVLVNNAGLISYEMMAMIDFDFLRKMFDVNVFAMIQMMQLASRLMSRQKSGSIINMASIVGSVGVKGQLGYAASKGAVIALTKSAAKELAADNIRVNAIAPGMVGTERLKDVMENKFSDRINSIGFGRLAEPEEIADAAVFLASDMSSYISGQILGVDGVAIL